MLEILYTYIGPHHVRKVVHLHPTSSCQKGFALTSDLIMSERICTYIRPHHLRKALHLHLTSSCQKGVALTSNLIMSERHCTYIRPHHVRKALHLHPTSWCQKGTLSSSLSVSPKLKQILGNWPGASILPENGLQHLYMIMWEHIPQPHQNGSAVIMWEHIP